MRGERIAYYVLFPAAVRRLASNDMDNLLGEMAVGVIGFMAIMAILLAVRPRLSGRCR